MAAILLVEDDAIVREVAQMMIEEWGHSIFAAGDADEALSHLNSSNQIHALMTDIYLKREAHGGFKLAQAAFKIRPHLRVLYMTGHSLTDEMKAQFVEGARCLGKPYTERELRDAVDRLVAPTL
jgi:DNA-binding NtrC family response regulator